MSLIKLENISKIYGRDEYNTPALKSVSLTIEKGEFVSIMGPSGSGKSTLLNIIGLMDIPTQGDYKLDGISINNLTDKEMSTIRNRTISFVFQHFALMENYTVYENVALPLFKRELSLKEKKEKINYYLETLGIADLTKKNVSKLSGGQKQRVAIARAMVAETEIILADEPTGSLDQKNGEIIMELLKDMNKKGKCIIVVTHDDKVSSFTKRKISILDGNISDDSVVF